MIRFELSLHQRLSTVLSELLNRSTWSIDAWQPAVVKVRGFSMDLKSGLINPMILMRF